MDAAGIAAFLVAAQRQDTRMAVATAVIKQQQAQEQTVLGMLADGLQAGAELQAAPPPGMGLSVDVTA